MSKIWYVTGASKGLGLSLVKKLLAAGCRVAATSRNKAALEAAVDAADPSRFLALEVDLADSTSIEKSVVQAQGYFGGLDVVVNNAGYGSGGSVEELELEEIRDNFEVNVFAMITVIRSALPFLRAQSSGYIINISSIAGFTSTPGWSIYNATKFAVTGFSEALAGDVAELGIKVTVVMPGAFRTQFLTGESLFIAKNHIPDYGLVHATHQRFAAMNGSQAGDPEKAADVFIALAENPAPPVRLFLGSDAYKRAALKSSQVSADMKRDKELSESTDYSA